MNGEPNVQNNDFRRATIGGGIAGRDYTGNIIHNHGQQQGLAEAAAEIQKLLEQLEQTYSTDTTTGKMQIAAEAIERIKDDPNLAERILSALKAGGAAALAQLLSHPAASFAIAALDDWHKIQKS